MMKMLENLRNTDGCFQHDATHKHNQHFQKRQQRNTENDISYGADDNGAKLPNTKKEKRLVSNPKRYFFKNSSIYLYSEHYYTSKHAYSDYKNTIEYSISPIKINYF